MASLKDSDPRHIAAYRLVERLAVGGMGIVYLGESPSGRPVAVKLIRPDLASDPEFRERFRREVEAAQLVGGFHTAAVVDADPDADPPWMVTQYVRGPSLDAKVKHDGPLDPAAVHQLGAALAEGLHAIHSRGLVHRDLKPLNIIMADDGPRIIDFGIAKAAGAGSDPRLTATGKVVGTPAFLSPEQLEGSLVGPASDIFSLGSVLAFAATGRAPFDTRNFTATSYAIVNKPPDLRPLAGPLLGIITACLAKAPASRPTASALLTYLYRTRPSPSPSPPSRAAGEAGQAAVPAATARPDPGRPDPARSVPRSPLPAGPASIAPAPANPPPVRATVRRPVLMRRASPPRVPVSRTAGTQSLLQPGPPQVQVRPARNGWRLVTAGVDGRWLASANGDGIITAWAAESGLPVRSWSAGARVRAMTAGAGDLLVVATDDGRVTAWDATTGTARPYLPDSVPGLTGPGVRVRSLALDSSNTWLAASVAGRLLLWDVADPSEPLLAAGLPCPAEATALAFDDKGWQLAVGDEGGKVHVWNLEELAAAAPVNAAPGAPVFGAMALETAWIYPPGTLPDASRPHAGRVLALAWDGTGDRWLSAGPAGPHDWLDGAAAKGGEIEGVPLRAAALSPDGGFAAMIDDVRGRVYLTSLDGPARPRALDGSGLVITGVAFAGSGMLALSGSDGSLNVWDTSRHRMRVISAAGSPVTAVAASPDGTQLVVSDKRSELRSFAAVNGALEPGWTVDSAEPVECLAFPAGGTRVVTAGDAVRIRDAVGGAETGILPGRTGRARAVAAEHDGKRIAAAWAEAVVTVWEGKKLLWELAGHKGAVLTVAFGPRPGLLVSAGDDETIRTWDLATGKEAACHSQLGYRATVLTASLAGTRLAAGCADGTIRLYEAGQLGTLPDWADAPVLTGHVHGITAMSFDISGRYLATASRDGTGRIWDLTAHSATAVLLPGAAAVVSPDGTWHGLGETDGLIWQAAGLTRVPLPILEAVT